MTDKALTSLTRTSSPVLPGSRLDVLVNDAGNPRMMDALLLMERGGTVFVNAFYKPGEGPTGSSQPLSGSYATLEDAQADYPAATSLDDEKDWCAWQAATNYIYTRDDTINAHTYNWSSGKIVSDGQYVVNKTITFNHVGIIVEGLISATRFGFSGSTTITYNGPDGTLDEPVYIFDFYLFDEFEDPPSGRKGNATYSGGGSFRIYNITFYGKGATITGGAVPGDTGYVSGVRIRKASYAHVAWCTFSGSLWDGLRFTDAQLFPIVENNNFNTIHRDGLCFDVAANFSTTMTVRKNEFAVIGRYALLMDLSGSIESGPVIWDNDFEHPLGGTNSYFYTHPEWFVNGVVAGVCIIGGGVLNWQANRYENNTTHINYLWADLHIVYSTSLTLIGGSMAGLALTGRPQTGDWSTSAYDDYLTTYGHSDITDERNFNSSSSGNSSDNGDVVISHVKNLGYILLPDGTGLSSSGTHAIEDCGSISFHSVPTKDGTYAKIVRDRADTASLYSIMARPGNVHIRNTTITDTSGTREIVSMMGTIYGDYRAISGASWWSAWQAGTAYSATVLKGSSSFVRPTTENGYFYQCTVSGTSDGSTEPTWPTTVGNTVTDGTVTWKCVGTVFWAADNSEREWLAGSRRHKYASAAPASGKWSVGDKVFNTAPASGSDNTYANSGIVGWVCTTAGAPGTWRQMKGIFNA